MRLEDYYRNKFKVYGLLYKKTGVVHSLFCIPFAGEVASKYVSWKKYVPNNIEVIPIQIPGRENRVKEVFGTDLRKKDNLIKN